MSTAGWLQSMYPSFVSAHRVSRDAGMDVTALVINEVYDWATTRLRNFVLANPHVASTRKLKMNFKFAKRVAITMRKSRIKTSLQRLDDCTRRIDTWIERAGKI
jgi:hypothetical protein